MNFNAEKHTKITAETHPIGTTRCYEDKEGRIFAVKRNNTNGFKVTTNAFKNNVWATLPHGSYDVTEWGNLAAYKDKSNGSPDVFQIYLLA